MNSLLSSISSRFSAGDGRQAFRSSRNLAAARVLSFGTLRNPEDNSELSFGNFRMYAEERGLTIGAGGTLGDRPRLKGKKGGQGLKQDISHRYLKQKKPIQSTLYRF